MEKKYDAIAGSSHHRWQGGKPKCLVCKKHLSSYKAQHCKKHVPFVMTNERRKKIIQTQNKTWLGRKLTDEHRANLSISHKGIKPTTPFSKGNIPWNAGKSTTKIEKACAFCTKLYIPKYYHRAAKFCSMSCFSSYFHGENNPNWKGGISQEHELIRKSDKYVKWRLGILKRDNFICQICNKRGGKLQVDHIAPFWAFPDLRFEDDNGRTLCIDCHLKTDTWGGNALKTLQTVN